MSKLPLPTLIIFLLLFSSCNEEMTTNNHDIYDFHILYSYQGESMSEWYNTNYDQDILYITVESGFVDDTISISANGKPIAIDTIVHTNDIDGLAAGFQIVDINKIQQLSLKVNSSPTVSFEVARKDFIFMGISKDKKSIEVVFYKKPPTFY